MKRPLGAVSPVTSPPSPRWLRWRMIGVLSIILGGAGAAFILLRPAREMQVRVELPTPPDLAGQPAILKERLAQAEARARANRTRLEGAAELGRLYHANGFPLEAGVCWQLLRANQPNEARWCYYLADTRRDAGDNTGLDILLEVTLRLAPDYASWGGD